MIALHPTVHDSLVALLCDAFLGDGRVNPVWKAPVFWRDLPPFYWCTGVVQDCLPKCLVEVTIVQEDIGVVKPAIEMSLD